MGTVVTGAVVVVIVGLIIRSMVRDKKNGKSLQCGGDVLHARLEESLCLLLDLREILYYHTLLYMYYLLFTSLC